MKKINVLVVGGGMYSIGRGTKTYGTILPALLEGRRQNIVGKICVATTNESTANNVRNIFSKLSELMGVDGQCEFFPKSGTDPTAYLKAADEFKPEATVVSVPDHLHSEICISLINKGLHCLVVKPMAPTTKEAKAMIEASKKAGVVAEVEFHKRFDESNILMQNKIQSGELGDLLYAVIEYSQQKRMPTELFSSWSNKTNVFQYLGVHYVDLIQFVTGFKPLKVTAWGQKEYLYKQGIDTWDSIQAVIQWQRQDGGEFISTHLTNWIDPNKTSSLSDQKINIVGTKSRFQSDQKNRGVQFVSEDMGVNDINPYFSSSFKDVNTGYLNFTGYGIRSVLSFINDINLILSKKLNLKDLEKNRPTFVNCLVSTAIIQAVEKSLGNKSATYDVNT